MRGTTGSNDQPTSHLGDYSMSMQPFDFRGRQVRVFTAEDGEPRFVLNDLCAVLEIGNARQVRARLDEECVSQADVLDGRGIRRPTTVVDESGMYEVILRSDKPEAVEFRRWITRDVLPQIRRTGSYGVPAPQFELPQTFAEALRELADTTERADKAERRAVALDDHKRAIEAGDGITVTEFGKKYFSEVPAKKFQEYLYTHGYQIDQRNIRWCPVSEKYKNGREHGYPAAKGRPYIYNHDGGVRGGRRRFNPRIRPQMELQFRDRLAAEGLPVNKHSTGLVLISNDDMKELGA